MINREARQLVYARILSETSRLLAGHLLLPTTGLVLSRAILSANIHRLPDKVDSSELQNAQGQFFWLEGWSHPDGGDVQ